MSSNVGDLLYGYLPEGAEAMNSVLHNVDDSSPARAG